MHSLSVSEALLEEASEAVLSLCNKLELEPGWKQEKSRGLLASLGLESPEEYAMECLLAELGDIAIKDKPSESLIGATPGNGGFGLPGSGHMGGPGEFSPKGNIGYFCLPDDFRLPDEPTVEGELASASPLPTRPLPEPTAQQRIRQEVSCLVRQLLASDPELTQGYA